MEDVELYVAQYADYLEEIRKRLYRVVIVFIGTFLIGFCFTNEFVKFFIHVLGIKDVTIVVSSPFQLIDLAMSIGFFAATVITMPYVIQQAYSFLRPGLLPEERKIFFTLIPAALLLFCVGFTYGFLVMYYAFQIIAKVNVSFGIVNLWDITQFISQIMLTSSLLGVIFEFPIVLTLLIRLNVIQIDFLRVRRRIAYAIIFIFVALLPPTDGLSFIVMSIPLVGIYELTIFFNSFSRRKEIYQ